MAYRLTGIANENALRMFTFEAAGGEPAVATIVVAVDLNLARRYLIALQDLPLLCLGLLERSPSPEKAMVFAEAEMIDYARLREETKALKARK
jgi:hypothetical protein